MPMTALDKLAFLRDPRLAAHATAAFPAWLWNDDGTEILWANPPGAAVFGADAPAAIAGRQFEAGQPAAQQIVRLAGSLPQGGPPRLERLRGFGAGFGRMLLCACSRIALPDARAGILVTAVEAAGPNLSLAERIRRLFATIGEPLAAFSPDGALLHASDDAGHRLGAAATLAAAGAGALTAEALSNGHASGDTPSGPMSLARIGTGNAVVLIATLEPISAPPSTTTATDIPLGEEATPIFFETPAAGASATEGGALHATHSGDDRSSEIEAAPPRSHALNEAPAAPQSPSGRRHPLRFVWQTDAEGRFTVGSDEFVALLGAGVAAVLGRPWTELAATLALDPDQRVARALASRDTWSGIAVAWPVEGTAERMAAELSGLPMFDRERAFRGYRGFGVCRDVARLNAIASARRAPFAVPASTAPPAEEHAPPSPDESAPAATEHDAGSAPDAPTALDQPQHMPEPSAPPPTVIDSERPESDLAPSEAASSETVSPEPPESEISELPPEPRPQPTLVPAAKNVVPFRGSSVPAAEKRPTLTPVERTAFQEIAKALGARMEGEEREPDAEPEPLGEPVEHAALVAPIRPAVSPLADAATAKPEPVAEPALPRQAIPSAYGTGSEIPATAATAAGRGERAVLDRVPAAVLVYRGGRLLYANQALLDWTGYENVDAITAAGGLERLFAEPGVTMLGEPGDSDKALAITTRRGESLPVEGRLFSISWAGESALLTVLENGAAAERIRDAERALETTKARIAASEQAVRDIQERIAAAEKALRIADDRLKISELGLRAAESATHELESVLDTATDGVVVVEPRRRDRSASNRSAEALFGYDSRDLAGQPLRRSVRPREPPCALRLSRRPSPRTASPACSTTAAR